MKRKIRPHKKNQPLRSHVDESELRQIVAEAVLSIEQTAKHFGVSVPTITRRMRRFGLKSKKGRGSPMEKNYFWRGGRWIDPDGYVMIKIPGHPYATKDGYVREHRLVMEKALGRYLFPGETVHHKKSDEKANNDPSNLVVYQSNSEHFLAEHRDPLRDPHTGQFLPKPKLNQPEGPDESFAIHPE